MLYLQYILVSAAILVLIGLSTFFVTHQNEVVTQTAVSSYQQTELEIVRDAARSVEAYVYVQTQVLGRTDADTIEQEIFQKFIDPIHLLKSGDAWIYAPDHVVFDRSSDFPEEYRGKSMAQIFAMQEMDGASHYKEMTADVTNAREGVGWYIWLPEKGPEIAAWTPVHAGNYTWTIGLSTPLPEILEATGASRGNAVTRNAFALGILMVIILGVAGLYTDLQRWKTEESLQKTSAKLNLMSRITRHDILNKLTPLTGYIELAKEETQDPTLHQYFTKMEAAARAIRTQIEFTRDYQDIGVNEPLWQDVRELLGSAVAQVDLHGIAIRTDMPNLEIYADPLLPKVFYNLADNAARYGEITTEILIRFQETGQGATLVFGDNGVGIPARMKEKIFEQGVGRNTGLGLFLVREILGITGITISESGEHGKGARFEIQVPRGAYRHL
jgi:signal transduction histidine kinase